MIKLDYWLPGSQTFPIEQYQVKIREIHNKLHQKTDDYSGWVDWPVKIDPDMVQDILDTAEEIKRKCTAFVVIGIGGSYLGAKACVELLKSQFYNEVYAAQQKTPKIFFAGHHLSTLYYSDLFERLSQEDICLCVISKSGTTLEPSVIFELFQNYMVERYGEEEAAKRIYAITDAERGSLRAEAEEKGYKSFVIPEDIGGRYSVQSIYRPLSFIPFLFFIGC